MQKERRNGKGRGRREGEGAKGGSVFLMVGGGTE